MEMMKSTIGPMRYSGAVADLDSWRHSLFDCTMAKCTRTLASEEVAELMVLTHASKASNLIFELIEKLPQPGLTMVLVTLLAIWMIDKRSFIQVYFGVRYPHIASLGVSWRTWTCYNLRRMTTWRGRGTWSRHLGSLLQRAIGVNVDVVFDKQDSKGAATAIVINFDGDIMGASIVISKGIRVFETLESLVC